jgi:hypothetical protein
MLRPGVMAGSGRPLSAPAWELARKNMQDIYKKCCIFCAKSRKLIVLPRASDSTVRTEFFTLDSFPGSKCPCQDWGRLGNVTWRAPRESGEVNMVSNCANPKCSKPLLYLREGRIFVFDMPVTPPTGTASGRGAYRLEHFWLCGECSQTLLLQQTTDHGVQLVARRGLRQNRPAVAVTSVEATPSALAS